MLKTAAMVWKRPTTVLLLLLYVILSQSAMPMIKTIQVHPDDYLMMECRIIKRVSHRMNEYRILPNLSPGRLSN